jgi:hypothetical protein
VKCDLINSGFVPKAEKSLWKLFLLASLASLVNKVQAILSPKGSTINFRNVIQPLTVHENPRNSVGGS